MTRSALAVAAAAIALAAVAAPVAAGSATTIEGISVIGEVTIPTGTQFAETEVGGLSGIVYDERRDNYMVISDDRSSIDPARFYTIEIDIPESPVEEVAINFVKVDFVPSPDGDPYQLNELDPEGIAIARPGNYYVSSEGDTNALQDPFVNRYSRRGKYVSSFPLPGYYSPDGTGEFGIRQNLSLESLSATPNRRTLYTANEGALAQDGPASDVGNGSFARILELAVKGERVKAEYVYEVDPVVDPPVPPNAFRVNGLVELLALDDHGTLLAMERSFSVGIGNNVRIYEISTAGATNVLGIDDLYDETTGTPVSFTPVSKRLLVDVEDAFGIVPDNLEGLALGPPLEDGRIPLVIVSDNNFNPFQTNQFVILGLTVGD